jgi:DNA-binding GntR family transcriptional regulator
MNPLKRPQRALYEEVADQLRTRILAHELAPGSWIDEQVLCAQFGISRTPLREALKVLATEGLVTMKLRRGAYVTETSAQDLAEVFHLLALLESDAAAVVAQEASDNDLVELAALHQTLEDAAGDREAFFKANEGFHLRLLQLANNRWREHVVADLRKVMKLNRHHSLLKEGRLHASLNEHRHLMKALLTRDPDKARQLMSHHIQNGQAAATP